MVLDANGVEIPGVATPASVTPAAVTPGASSAQGTLNSDGSSATPNDDKNKGGDGKIPLAALHEEREKRQSLQAQLDQMTGVLEGMGVKFDQNNQVVQPQQQFGQNQQQPGYFDQFGTPTNNDQQMQELWDTDPRKAMQGEMLMAMDWRDKVDSAMNSQINIASVKHKDFNTYRNDIEGHLKSLPVNQRANQGIVEAAYYLVKGQKVDSIVEEAQRDIYGKIQRGEQIQGLSNTTSSATTPSNAATLSQQEKAAAGAMGLSEAEYLKFRR